MQDQIIKYICKDKHKLILWAGGNLVRKTQNEVNKNYETWAWKKEQRL